jgi:hypothetical protein
LIKARARWPAPRPPSIAQVTANLTDAQIHEALARDAAAQSRPLPANIHSGIVRFVLSRNHMRKIAKKRRRELSEKSAPHQRRALAGKSAKAGGTRGLVRPKLSPHRQCRPILCNCFEVVS